MHRRLLFVCDRDVLNVSAFLQDDTEILSNDDEI